MYDEAEMPLDYIWLDIDHTSHRKYFTWNPQTFPNPQAMVNNLAAHKRNLVSLLFGLANTTSESTHKQA